LRSDILPDRARCSDSPVAGRFQAEIEKPWIAAAHTLSHDGPSLVFEENKKSHPEIKIILMP
jgi:hypothetical protein